MTDDTLYRIRPLEWVKSKHAISCRTPVGIYTVIRRPSGSGMYAYYLPQNDMHKEIHSLDLAFSACEAHYRERLTQCLIPNTPEENNE